MYEETGCFDSNSISLADDAGFSQSVPSGHNTVDELSYSCQHQQSHNPPAPLQEDAAVPAMELELQKHLAFNVENCPDDTHLIHDPNQLLPYDQSIWDTGVNDPQQNGHQSFVTDISASLQQTPYAQTPDLLNLLHLPRCTTSSFLPSSSISFTNPTQNHRPPLGFDGDLPPASDHAPSLLYDPLFRLNLPPQPPLFRELFQSVPNGYNLLSSRGSANSLLGDERDASADLYEDGDVGHLDNRVLEFTSGMACNIGRAGRLTGNTTKHYATERQRRENMNEKYAALKDVIPNPTKDDRASVVGDAIEYIQELLRTVNELKLLVERKRCSRERSKRQKTEDDENSDMKPVVDSDPSYNASLRSSWLQRKSKSTEVDVRIIDDEVTIKLVQRKKIDCLLVVSKVLDELQLDLHHVAGGHIGDYYSFLFNTKIYEGSSVYAGAIANKLIEVMDKQYAATPPTSCSY